MIKEFIRQKIEAGQKTIFLYVLESIGSSPGRRGFKMAVAEDGSFQGTIGGGIMEFKMVEKARSMLQAGFNKIEATQQYHDKAHGTDQSGMICSGSQFLAFVALGPEKSDWLKGLLESLQAGQNTCLSLSPEKLDWKMGWEDIWQYNNEREWYSEERLSVKPVVHIVGGGHVSLALSELLHYLEFQVRVYDDRPGLSTLDDNRFADQKVLVNYEDLLTSMTIQPSDFVVIMTIGYRTDKLLLKQLLSQPCFYLGMLGSQKKIETLMKELRDEGFKESDLKKVFAPIGLPIFSQTTREIAVSIAAEMIQMKNKNLPSGRQ
jgi:xanthine dehydrogenase accessory factor